MRLVVGLTILFVVDPALQGASVSSHSRTAVASKKIALTDTKVRMPLAFERNLGQAREGVRFVSRTMNGSVLIDDTGATFLLPEIGGARASDEQMGVRMVMRGGRTGGSFSAEGKLDSYSNYLLGSNPAAWRTHVPHYSKIRYKNIYPGIELLYYGTERMLEYDFIVAPGADYSVIELAFEGADHVHTDRDGNLLIERAGRTIRQMKPLVYQRNYDGQKQEIRAGYRISSDGAVHFALGRFDRTRALVIDPVVQFATYIGGSGYDVGLALATDAAGSMYMTGQTNSGTLPTSGQSQQALGGATDAFIAKFNASGDGIQWITYFGGSEPDVANAIAVDSTGATVITGFTLSGNLPTKNPVIATLNGELDAYVAKLNPAGTDLIYSTYLGGSLEDFGIGVAVDGSGAAYVTGWTVSPDFPTRAGFQSTPTGGGRDAFVTKLTPDGSQFAYSTYVGGNGEEYGAGIAVDAQGNAYVTGSTTSTYMANQATDNRGGEDSYVFKLSSNGRSVEYLRVVGGSQNDVGYSIAVDTSGSAYVSGYTLSSNFPATGAALQRTLGGTADVIVYKLNPAGTATEYATFIGGSAEEFGFGSLKLDAAGTVYVTGWTASADFPVRNSAQARFGGGRYDAFVARVAPAGGSLLYSTYLGGSGEENAYGLALDRQGNVTITGWTSSPNFPSAVGALTASSLETRDVFVARLSADTSVALLGASPSILSFSVRSGQTVPSQTIQLASTGQPLQFSAGANVPWIQVSASGTTTPASLTVSIDAASLAAGTNSGEITINAPSGANSPVRIPVSVVVEAVPAITSVSPNPLVRGTQNVQITVSGVNFPSNSVVFVNNAQLQTTFVNATTLTAMVPATLLGAVTSVQVNVRTGQATSAGFTVPVTSGLPVITSAGIVSAATNLGGAVSPGLLVTIYGTGIGPDVPVAGAPDTAGQYPTLLGDTRVLVDGIAAPLVDVRSNQVSAVVPFAVGGRSSVQVEIESKGQRSGAVSVQVVATTPGLFTAQASGTGPAAAVNENNSSNSTANPAARGSVIVFFATGLGTMTPAVPDGRIVAGETASLPRPVADIAVTIGGIRAEVLYVGAAPGAVAGLSQLNVRVPVDIAPGDAVPVVITAGSASSREGVTIAVR